MNYEYCQPGVRGREPPPALPPRPSRDTTPTPTPRRDLKLERAVWYWGTISQEEISEKLSGQPDGTFLVRDSQTTSGEYTLCLRKGGSNKLIRICCRRGKFGFSEPCQFDSVVKLIDHYRRESLRDYNEQLDLRLERPLVESRQYHEGYMTSSLIEELRNTHAEYSELVAGADGRVLRDGERAGELERLDRRISALTASIIIYKKAQMAYEEVGRMFSEQVQIAQSIKAELHEKEKVHDNKRQLESRVEQVQQRQQQVKQEIHRQTNALKTAEHKLGTVHQKERNLLQSKQELERELQRRGVPRKRLEKLREGDDVGPTGADCPPLSEQKDRWLLEGCDRPRAEAVLHDKPEGTFLIRRQRDKRDTYVLSIRANFGEKHIKIHRSERGYGFSVPYAIHSSLEALVEYYHSESELGDFNDTLPERLMYPALPALPAPAARVG